MAINVGWIDSPLTNDAGTVVASARFYYDTAWLDGDPARDPSQAPLVNGPRGWCLDVTNTSGRNLRVQVDIGGTTNTLTMGQGDPVTTGPQNGRSRTAAQLASAYGLATRGDVGALSLSLA